MTAKVTGRHLYVHNLRIDGMWHGRVCGRNRLRRASSRSMKARSRISRTPVSCASANFLGVAAPDEWDAICAARALKATWERRETLTGHEALRQSLRAGPFESEETLTRKGDAARALAGVGERLAGEYYWPVQTHGSMGPSCAVADVRDGKATIWTASQATHRFRLAFAQFLGLPGRRRAADLSRRRGLLRHERP